MKKTWISDTPTLVGKIVELYGWAQTVRDHKKVVFIDLRDASGLVQIVGDAALAEISPESVVYVKGLVKDRPEHLKNDKIATGAI